MPAAAASRTKEFAENAAQRRRWFLPVALFLLVPTLYVFGRSYSAAWLRKHQLTETTFPMSVDGAIFQSYAAAVSSGLAALPWMGKVGIMLLVFLLLWAMSALAIVVWAAIETSIRTVLKRAGRMLRPHLGTWEARKNIAARSYVMAATPLLLVGGLGYAYLLLLVPLVAGHYIGTWQGERSYSEIQARIVEASYKDGEQVIVEEGGRATLRLLICSEYGCGGMDAKGTRFIKWDAIAEIRAWKDQEAAILSLNDGADTR